MSPLPHRRRRTGSALAATLLLLLALTGCADVDEGAALDPPPEATPAAVPSTPDDLPTPGDTSPPSPNPATPNADGPSASPAGVPADALADLLDALDADPAVDAVETDTRTLADGRVTGSIRVRFTDPQVVQTSISLGLERLDDPDAPEQVVLGELDVAGGQGLGVGGFGGVALRCGELDLEFSPMPADGTNLPAIETVVAIAGCTPQLPAGF